MSDIFISYSKADREKAARLAELLEKHGWTLWWDNDIPAGRTWTEVIQQALDQARCVIVLWSSTSLSSHWVNTEAREGLQRGILVPVMLEDVTMPLEFRSIQSVSLSSWPDHASEQEIHKLVRAVGLTVSLKTGRSTYIGSPAQQRSLFPPVTLQKRTLLDAVNLPSTYFGNLLQLIAEPKTFLASELEQSQRALRGATLFLLASYIVGFLLGIPLQPRNLLASFFADMAFFFFAALVFGFAVYFSWRLVGAKAPLRDFLVIHFYCAGVLMILAYAMSLTTWGLMRLLSEPASFAQARDLLFCQGDIVSYYRLISAGSVTQPGLVLVNAMIWVVLGVMWIVAVWGAHRRLNNLSRTRSVLAGMIFMLLSFVAQGITGLAAISLLSPRC